MPKLIFILVATFKLSASEPLLIKSQQFKKMDIQFIATQIEVVRFAKTDKFAQEELDRNRDALLKGSIFVLGKSIYVIGCVCCKTGQLIMMLVQNNKPIKIKS